MGHHVATASSLRQGLLLAGSSAFDVVFLNAEMADGNALEASPAIIEAPSFPEVIIFTDAGDADHAEHAIKMGAWDYMERPATAQAMALTLVRAIQIQG